MSFSDALPLDEKRSCTKLATGSRHRADSLSSLSAGVFQRSETNTIHPPAAYVVASRISPPSRYRKLIWWGSDVTVVVGGIDLIVTIEISSYAWESIAVGGIKWWHTSKVSHTPVSEATPKGGVSFGIERGWEKVSRVNCVYFLEQTVGKRRHLTRRGSRLWRLPPGEFSTATFFIERERVCRRKYAN